MSSKFEEVNRSKQPKIKVKLIRIEEKIKSFHCFLGFLTSSDLETIFNEKFRIRPFFKIFDLHGWRRPVT